ncbi:MAG: hypothetical protein QMD21_00050, partial [Candidatus Thermoplasmatota archaeon]|nr:hypothetical protein [Candidatus Thermoplasmatota archaeon]
PHSKGFKLLAVVPSDAKVKDIIPKPEITDHIITWNLKKVPSLTKKELKFELEGLDREDFEESELYVEGIDPELVSGAEVWDQDAYEARKREMAKEELAEEEIEDERIEKGASQTKESRKLEE